MRAAIRAYASIASQIKVEYPGGINYEAIREALRLYMDRIKTVWCLNSVLDPKELYEMEKLRVSRTSGSSGACCESEASASRAFDVKVRQWRSFPDLKNRFAASRVPARCMG